MTKKERKRKKGKKKDTQGPSHKHDACEVVLGLLREEVPTLKLGTSFTNSKFQANRQSSITEPKAAVLSERDSADADLLMLGCCRQTNPASRNSCYQLIRNLDVSCRGQTQTPYRSLTQAHRAQAEEKETACRIKASQILAAYSCHVRLRWTVGAPQAGGERDR
jgi:hypothetical protein